MSEQEQSQPESIRTEETPSTTPKKAKRVVIKAVASEDSSDDEAYNDVEVKRKASNQTPEKDDDTSSESSVASINNDSDSDVEDPSEKKAKKAKKPRKPANRKRPAPSSSSDAAAPTSKSNGKDYTVGELETQAVLERLKAKRRKAELYTEEKKQQISQQVLDNMARAYIADIKALRNNQPAIEKLRALPQVITHAKDLQLQSTMVQGGLWIRLYDWLRPTEGVLPNVGLRTKLIDLIDGLMCDNDNLEQSGIGKMLNYLRSHKDETSENKRRINGILDRWTSRLFG